MAVGDGPRGAVEAVERGGQLEHPAADFQEVAVEHFGHVPKDQVGLVRRHGGLLRFATFPAQTPAGTCIGRRIPQLYDCLKSRGATQTRVGPVSWFHGAGLVV